jgi:pimeloyl-ACP methyl ester carboxylesterase
MRRIELTVDSGGGDHTTALVCLPEPERLPTRPVVAFCFPGGGYSRGYYDLRIDGFEGYSQAEHHAQRGIITVACDQLGVGDSSEPDRTQLSYENVAAADRATVDDVLRRLAAGEVEAGYPPIPDPVLIGIGQSYGGMLLIVQQARERTFDAIAVLGFSAIGLELPRPPAGGTSATGGALPPLESLTPRELQTFVFHWEDVPAELIETDMKGEHPTREPPLPMWASARRPGGRHWSPLPQGVVAHWARVIECPVLVGVGERDVSPDPWAEPGAYRQSRDITLAITPRMGHMHNFAGTRTGLWDRLASWMEGVAS